MNFKNGDIVVIPVPFTDNQTTKKRPAVVISSEDVHTIGDVLIVQITSKKSYIRLHKMFVLENFLIEKKVSALTSDAYTRLITAINKIIG
jgi:mRNA interferase MazF